MSANTSGRACSPKSWAIRARLLMPPAWGKYRAQSSRVSFRPAPRAKPLSRVMASSQSGRFTALTALGAGEVNSTRCPPTTLPRRHLREAAVALDGIEPVGSSRRAERCGCLVDEFDALPADLDPPQLPRDDDLKDHGRLVARPVEGRRAQQPDTVIQPEAGHE